MERQEGKPSWGEAGRNTVRVWGQRWQSPDRRTRVAAGLLVLSVATIATVAIFGDLRWPEKVASRVASAAGTNETLSASVSRQGQAIQAAPASVGRALAANKQLMLTPAARDQLTTGKVDQRVTSVLESLLSRHMIQVTTFGKAQPGEPLRSMTIDCIDELPIKPGSPETTSVLGFFEQLRPPLAPESVRLAKPGKMTVIEVTYPVLAR